MLKQIVVFSGPLAVGKSTLAELLRARFGFKVVKTRGLLQQKDPTLTDRAALQLAGTRLDEETGGAWVAKELQRSIGSTSHERVIVDLGSDQGPSAKPFRKPWVA